MSDGRSTELNVTGLLRDWRLGDANAAERVVPLLYRELRRLAHLYLAGERQQSLQTSDLVHDAFIKIDGCRDEWTSREHFFGTAATFMRRRLIDVARARNAAKRGGGAVRVPLDENLDVAREITADVLELDLALEALEKENPRQARIVELRMILGFSVEETAREMSLSPATVKRDWESARSWLRERLSEA